MRRALALALVVLVIAVVVYVARDPSQDATDPLRPATERRDEAHALAAPTAVRPPVRATVAAAPDADAGTCDVEIALVPALGRASGARTSAWCTDALGRPFETTRVDDWTYAVRALPPGRHRAAAVAPGHRRAHVDFEVRAGARSQRVELALDARPAEREVLVRLQTEDGRPFVPALAAAWPGSDGGWLAIRRADARLAAVTKIPGRAWGFALADHVAERRPGAPRDAFALVRLGDDAERVHLVLDERAVSAADVPAGVDEFVLRASVDSLVEQLGVLSGRLVGEDDRVPIEVLHAVVGDDRGRTRSRAAPSGAARERGVFAFTSLMPGRLHVRVTGGGACKILQVDLPAGADLDLGDVAIPSGCAFRVRVVDAAGRPLAARCAWFVPDDDARRPAPPHAVAVDSDGRREFPVGPVDGGVLLVSSAGRGTRAFALEPCGRRGEEIVVRLDPATVVALDVGTELGDDADDRVVLVSGADGVSFGEHAVGPTGLVALELAPGEYLAQRAPSERGTRFTVGTEPLVVAVE